MRLPGTLSWLEAAQAEAVAQADMRLPGTTTSRTAMLIEFLGSDGWAERQEPFSQPGCHTEEQR